MHIIREIESGKSKSDVSRELGLASSTVATIWKNRDGVLTAYENNVPVMTKSENESPEARSSSSPKTDDLLLMQMQETVRLHHH
jgi:transposase-like protein